MSFYKTFNKLCKVHDNTIVFRDWLDYSIDQFLINPDLKYFQHDKYNENEYKLLISYLKKQKREYNEQVVILQKELTSLIERIESGKFDVIENPKKEGII